MEMTLAQLIPDRTNQPAIIDESADIVISQRTLADRVERTADALRDAGLASGDAVALVLPNSHEFLILILALAQARLVAAPLNSAYKATELRGYLTDVPARAIVTSAPNPVVSEAAAGLGVPIWTTPCTLPGTGTLGTRRSSARSIVGTPGADDVALLLHTSGTEGPPKIVPLTHTNVLRSARDIAVHYQLTPADRTLLVLPLFHGHGLVGAALATLASGGTVIMTPRFSASRFWESFRSHGATWYTAVPTIHQILLERADADGAPRTGPRFIRSCSAALAPVVAQQLEARFGAPVIEAYGLTEASHQVASNPLPPRARKSGTVGFATGTEIAIIDAHGQILPADKIGEVAVRGPTVMHGYLNNPAANQATFVNGWLRSGDCGSLDTDGYLKLTGRIKEMINRGGEKISPTDVEAVLLADSAVAEAAAFGVPDAKYGEHVEAAVVLKGRADAEALRSFCRARLADFQVPNVIHIVSALPRNATGKIERNLLAARYGAS